MYKVIFENENFIIVDKKAMVLSVPSRLGEEESRPVLGRILEKDLKITLFPVHRLDFEVSGLIMFAKNSKAQKAGNRWFETKEVFKTYSAVCSILDISNKENFELNKTYEWSCMLHRGKKRAFEASHGKRSITHATLKEIKNGYYVWDLNPITGRSHQLRYEMYRHNLPIIGDTLYSSNLSVEAIGLEDGIALKAYIIDFRNASEYLQFGLPPKIEIDKIL